MLSLSTTVLAAKIDLHWQLPALWPDTSKPFIHFRAKTTQHTKVEEPEFSEESAVFSSDIAITGIAGQQFIVCAQQVVTDDFTHISEVTHSDHLHHLSLVKLTGELTVLNGKLCSEQLALQYPYNLLQLIRSDEPFLAVRKEQPRNDDGQTSLLPFDPSAIKKSLEIFQTGSSSGFDDNSDFKRPPFMPLLDKIMTNLILLPTLNLPANWREYLPFAGLYHWLTDQPETQAGLTLLMKFDGQPPITLRIGSAEYAGMAEHLLDTRLLLQWLAPKLNGREAFTQQLMDMADAINENLPLWNVETLYEIQRQLMIVLEQPDTEFSLEFEYSELAHILKGQEKTQQLPGSVHSETKATQSAVSASENDGEQINSKIETMLISPMQLATPVAAIVQMPRGKKHKTAKHGATGKKANNKKKSKATQRAGKDSRQQQDNCMGGQDGRPPPESNPERLMEKKRVKEYLTIKMEENEFQIDKNELRKDKRGQESPSEIWVYKDDKIVSNLLSLELNYVPLERRVWGKRCTPNALDLLLKYGTEAAIEELMNYYPTSVISNDQGELQEENILCKHNDCPVCLEHLITQPYLVGTVCRHYFHLWCFIQNMERGVDKKNCPMCRTNLTNHYEMLVGEANIREQQLHLAVQKGNEDKVALMLAAGADVDHINSDGDAAIHTAIRINHAGIVRLLIESGADLNINNRQGKSPQTMAEKNGNRLIVKALNDPKNVFFAVKKGKHKIVNAWLNDGHDPNIIYGAEGMTLLMSAAFYRHTNIVELLLERGADVDALGSNHRTALMSACVGNHKEIVAKLLERGARLDIRTERAGQTALMLATLRYSIDIVEILLNSGAKDYAPSVPGIGTTALITASGMGRHELVGLLLKSSLVLLNYQDIHGMTALMWAAQNGHINIVKLLLEREAQVNLNSENGKKTALGYAALNGHLDIMVALMAKGAKVNMGEPSPLHVAAFSGHKSAVSLLLDRGAAINHLDRHHQTALMVGCRGGHKHIVSFLLEKGADVHQQRKDGATATTIAFNYGHAELCDLLEPYGGVLIVGSGSSGMRALSLKELLDF